MKIDLLIEKLGEFSRNNEGKNRELLKRLGRKSEQEVDELFYQNHNEIFSEVDCLECANCCKKISPIVTDKDIERISKKLKLKPSEMVTRYLTIDEDEDYVFRSQPCPFLMTDNYCLVYDVRPKACREYPHTDRKKISKIFPLTIKNASICPAVYLILENIHNQE